MEPEQDPHGPIDIWTDGGCKPNPGPGGWAAIVVPPAPAEPIELSGGHPDTTNNRMEYSAALEALRSLPAGIDQRSPARHPDWLGPDDLSLKVQEIREATDYRIPIQLKLGAARVYDDVRMAAKCGPDIIYLDGAEGSTGAGPGAEGRDDSSAGVSAGPGRGPPGAVGAGCAVSNYIGNEGNHIVAAIAIAATLAFIMIVLKPIDLGKRT